MSCTRNRERVTSLQGCVWKAVCGVLLLVSDLPARNSTPATAPRVPDVLIMVFSTNLSEDQVAITYNKPVSEATARNDAERLSRSGVWTLHGYTMTTNRSLSETTINFQSPAIVVHRSGVLPVGPFLVTFKRFTDVRLSFVIPRDVPCKTAWKKYISRDFEIRLNQTPSKYSSTCTFDVHLFNHGFERATIPTDNSSRVSADRQSLGHKAALLTLIALTCAVVITGVAGAAMLALWNRRQWRRLDATLRSRSLRRLY